MNVFLEKSKAKENQIQWLIVGGMFVFFILWSILQPLNASPDELMRFQICEYIFQYKQLPYGGDPAIRNEVWGYSYAFFPILSYMISAVFMWIANLFTQSAFALLMAARLVNILLGVGTVYLVLQIGKKLFRGMYRYLFVVFVAALPQFVFVFSYVNNDGLALFSSAWIVLLWIRGLETDWDKRTCIELAIALSLCILSYYNAYGFVLCSGILCLTTMKEHKWKKIGFLLIVVLALTGWWFLRNACKYDGDFLGLTTSEQYSEHYGAPGIRPSERQIPYQLGTSLLGMLIQQGWIKVTALSFVGCFGFMQYPLKLWMYMIYGITYVIGAAGCVVAGVRKVCRRNAKYENVKHENAKQEDAKQEDVKHKNEKYENTRCKDAQEQLEKHTSIRRMTGQRKWMFYGCLMISIIIPNILNIYHSYMVDFEPQGRYSLLMLIPFAICLTYGWKKLLEKIPQRAAQIIRGIVVFGLAALTIFIYATIFAPIYLK